MLCFILIDYGKEMAISFLFYLHILTLVDVFLISVSVVRKFQELKTAVIFGKNGGMMVITVNTGV